MSRSGLQFANIHSAFDARAKTQNQAQTLTGGTRRLTIFADVTGTGEGLLQFDFPVRYQEHPAFTYGWEILDNTPLIVGYYPTVSVGVYRWKIAYAPGNGARIWVGATMLVVVTGPPEQAETLPIQTHCQFEARTLQGGV